MGATERGSTSPADAAFHRLLLLLLAVLVLAGTLPLFASGGVYRFFHSWRVFTLAAIGVAGALLPGLLALRAARRAASQTETLPDTE